MSMRISSGFLLALLLAGCGEATTDQKTLAKAEAAQGAEADENGTILCAHKGSDDFERVCTVDREDSDQGLILTVSHPDGAFHKLLVTKDGRGVIAADGAEKATVSVLDADRIQVSLGGDRYQLPATVKGGAKAGS